MTRPDQDLIFVHELAREIYIRSVVKLGLDGKADFQLEGEAYASFAAAAAFLIVAEKKVKR